MGIGTVGSHWMHPDRNLHGRRSASVELVYRVNPSAGFDFASAKTRVQAAINKNCEVYLRVDETPGQTLPATNDTTNLNNYLNFCVQIVTDPVLKQITGLQAGNEPNLSNERRISGVALTADWCARCVYGYGRATGDTSNVYQYVATYNSTVRVYGPPVGPWNTDTDGTMAYTAPRGRSQASPWERYQYELAWKAYNNNWHVPYGNVRFGVHTYSRTGTTGTANGGANEPWSNVTGAYGAYWGTQWLDDCIAAIAAANGGASPPIAITEWNSYTDAAPQFSYPTGLLQQVVSYIRFKPNVDTLCQFVDQNYGNSWAQTCMTMGPSYPKLYAWNNDYDNVLTTGW